MGATVGATTDAAHGDLERRMGLSQRRPGRGASGPQKLYGQSQLTGSRCDFLK
jgi:hypothetical protein